MSGAHAFLPPSGAACWEACAAWPMMNATFPQDDTEAALEGTAAHWCWDAPLSYGQALPMVGTYAPNGVQVTDEMLDAAELYMGVIAQDLRAAGLQRDALCVEQRIAIGVIHPQNWGTPDTWFFDPGRWVLNLYDFKYGHGFVDAWENWQCVDYAAGVLDFLAQQWGMPLAVLDQRVRVRITVVQPRNYDTGGPVRVWEVPASDLRALWNKLAAAAERALVYPPVATPGPVQCEHCPGSHACAPLQRQGYQAVHFAERATPALLTPAATASELRLMQDHLQLLKARITGLEADAEARLRRGETVPGFGLEDTKGREAWNVPPEQVLALGGVFGVDVAKPGLITPTQARAKGLPAAVVAELAGQPMRGKRLARVSQSDVAKAFGKL